MLFYYYFEVALLFWDRTHDLADYEKLFIVFFFFSLIWGFSSNCLICMLGQGCNPVHKKDGTIPLLNVDRRICIGDDQTVIIFFITLKK